MKLNAKITNHDLHVFVDNYETIIQNIIKNDNFKEEYLYFYKQYLISMLFDFFKRYETMELNNQLLCSFEDKVLTFINSKWIS